VLIAILAVAGLRHLHRKPSDDGAAIAVPAPAVRNSTAAHPNNESKVIAALVPKKPPTTTVPPPQFPLHAPLDQADQVVVEVRSAAEAGDVAAMRILGEALNKCAHADMRSDEEIEAPAAKWSIDLEYAKKQGVAFGNADLPRMAAGRSEAKKRLRDSCRKIPAEDINTASVWIDRAADSGDEDAAYDRAALLAERTADLITIGRNSVAPMRGCPPPEPVARDECVAGL